MLAVTEVFGPTIQGEGTEAGTVVMFVRLAGCDFRCKWCDTVYALGAVEGDRQSVASIVADLNAKVVGETRRVVLTGGNPCLQENAGELVEALHEDGWHVGMETQGSIFREWAAQVDHLALSPKPPSSGMPWDADPLDRLVRLWRTHREPGQTAEMKVAVFDDKDLEFAAKMDRRYGNAMPLVLSVGTSWPSAPIAYDHVAHLLKQTRWLVEEAVKLGLPEVRVMPQLHALLWGDERGR